MTPDPLLVEIEKTREERQDAIAHRVEWDRRIEVLSARLDGLERAAELRPAPVMAVIPARPASADGGTRKGRVPGAISKIWQGILQEMTRACPDGASDQQIADIARANSLPNLRPRDARRQMEKYAEIGYVEYANPLTRSWRITSRAAQKYGFAPARREPPRTETPDAPNALLNGVSANALLPSDLPAKTRTLPPSTFPWTGASPRWLQPKSSNALTPETNEAPTRKPD